MAALTTIRRPSRIRARRAGSGAAGRTGDGRPRRSATRPAAGVAGVGIGRIDAGASTAPRPHPSTLCPDRTAHTSSLRIGQAEMFPIRRPDEVHGAD